MERKNRGLVLVLFLLAGASGAVLTAEGRPRPEQAARSAAFQRLVGGLGFGPALDLSPCPFGFDPRLDGACAAECGPVPGGACFCPRHAGALFAYPPLAPPHGNA